jgi:hypothetical protein
MMFVWGQKRHHSASCAITTRFHLNYSNFVWFCARNVILIQFFTGAFHNPSLMPPRIAVCLKVAQSKHKKATLATSASEFWENSSESAGPSPTLRARNFLKAHNQNSPVHVCDREREMHSFLYALCITSELMMRVGFELFIPLSKDPLLLCARHRCV